MSVVADAGTDTGANADIALAMQGGGKFADRMEALSSMLAQIEQAKTDLQLGQAAKEAFAAADAMNAEAQRRLQDAMANAKGMVDEASARLNAATEEAAKLASDARAAAETTVAAAKAQADALFSDAQAQAAKLMSDAQAAMDAANAKMADAERSSQTAATIAAEAATKIEAADAKYVEYDALLTRLRDAMRA